MATREDYADINATLNETIKATRANSNLSDDGKKRLIAQAYVRADTKAAALKAGDAADMAKARRSAESRLFGMTQYDAKDAATVMLHRDARDRASRIGSDAEAAALLQSAVQSGDTTMARALLGRAFERGFQQTVDQYCHVMPADAGDVDELISMNLQEATAATAAGRLLREMTTGISLPGELPQNRGIIDRLAAEAGDVEETPAPPNFGGRGLPAPGQFRLSGGFDIATGELNTE